MYRIMLLTLCSFLLNKAIAEVKLPQILGDHMVLQRDKPIVIWGWANPKEKVSVTFGGKTKSVVADKSGNWKVTLDAAAAGGPYEMIIKGKNTIKLKDILIGDVWVCSGQSNMEWPISASKDAVVEIASANFPTIRHIKIPNTISLEPKEDVHQTTWEVCSPKNAPDFTAVGYFFARELTKSLSIPIGLINSSWGGTHVETWTSRDAFEQSDEFRSMIQQLPVLNLDSLARLKKEQTMKRIVDLQGKLPEHKEEAAKWREIDFDDAAWKAMVVPKLWEAQALGEVDGVVWLRKTITLQKPQPGEQASVSLGMIDDSDETYFNGVKIGAVKNKWNEKRNYTIPAELLRVGKNVIAIRIEDTGGGGGIHGDSSMLNIAIGDQKISLAGIWQYKIESILEGVGAIGPNSYPTLLYNAMIHPLLRTKIKGVIWYQGESNAGRAFQYRKAFPLMINDWRQKWDQGEFPFYFVQLASFNADNGNSTRGSTWAELREAQALTLSLSNTGMAVTTDIGDPVDIHPRNKQDVGKRLAALALNRTYDRQAVDSGPTYESMKVEENKVVITFTTAGKLTTSDKYGYVKGFEIAGADQRFHYAKASIEGNKVVVTSEKVSSPTAVRYNWADDASDGNLYNDAGFPAAPFRTDNWKGITEDAKFTF